MRRLEQQISENFIGVLFPKTAKEFVEEIIGDSGEAAVETAVYVTEGLEISPQQKARLLRCLNNIKEIICESNEPYKFADKNINVFDYCPHCGAKMDEGEQWMNLLADKL